ncbi:Hypothetical Protein FCC1311_079712 [Hondaea fermentalgiana]|uniref:Uncharacterized protein n=1 Tax=Hondaea fermentalgiana TaxID=2315210 RepID=A0A2R5GLH1_9STRA|nr:Hypothetical Protein FCC1311_079712 [Hondaea fermentalgiana]|eukprot:GBG31746.1 Hypothetical Protein FCC1311_079712 [Hondaea fermentalgiana]
MGVHYDFCRIYPEEKIVELLTTKRAHKTYRYRERGTRHHFANDEKGDVLHELRRVSHDADTRRASYSNWHRGFEADLSKFASVALLCRLKFDQAKVISGAWTGEPVRLRTAMALTCMERLADSLPNEQRDLMAELVDEVMRSVFYDIARRDVEQEPVTGADVLDTDAYQTFFDRCKVLSREVNTLRAQISQMQQELKHSSRRPRPMASRSAVQGEGSSAANWDGRTEDEPVDAAERAENISFEFASLDGNTQRHLITDLVLEMADRPTLATALTVVNGMDASDRAELLEVLRSNASDAL